MPWATPTDEEVERYLSGAAEQPKQKPKERKPTGTWREPTPEEVKRYRAGQVPVMRAKAKPAPSRTTAPQGVPVRPPADPFAAPEVQRVLQAAGKAPAPPKPTPAGQMPPPEEVARILANVGAQPAVPSPARVPRPIPEPGPDRPGFVGALSDVAAGLRQGTQVSVPRTMLGPASMSPDAGTSDLAARAMEQLEQEHQGDAYEMSQQAEGSATRRLLYDAAAALPPMALGMLFGGVARLRGAVSPFASAAAKEALALTARAGGGAVSAGVFGAPQAGEEVHRLIAAGVEPGIAATMAGLSGAAEGGLEAIGQGAEMRLLGQGIRGLARKGVGPTLRETAIATGTEVGSEGLTALAQDYLANVAVPHEMRDIPGGIVRSSLAALPFAGGVAGVGAAGNIRSPRKSAPETLRFPVTPPAARAQAELAKAEAEAARARLAVMTAESSGAGPEVLSGLWAEVSAAKARAAEARKRLPANIPLQAPGAAIPGKTTTDTGQGASAPAAGAQTPSSTPVEGAPAPRWTEDAVIARIREVAPQVDVGDEQRAAAKVRAMNDGLRALDIDVDAFWDKRLRDFTADKAPKDALRQDAAAPTFYSQAERVVAEKMPNRMGALALRGFLQKQGVKPGEMKWTGLDDFLAQQRPVTKEEALAFIRENAVDVQELVKGRTQVDRSRVETLEARHRELASVTTEAEGELSAALTRASADIERIADSWEEGGREEAARIAPEETDRYVRAEQEAQAAYEDAWRAQQPYQPLAGDTRYDQYTTPGGEGYRELLLTLPRRLAEAVYTDPHWSEPNVFAHIRFNGRTDADGKRTMFVEEVQSDWAQTGRERGFIQRAQDNAPRIAELEGRIAAIEAGTGDDGRTRAQQDELTRLGQELWDLRGGAGIMEGQAGATGRVPALPFAENWHEVAIKRVLRWAAENGYDRVAWTTGETQVQRYPANVSWRPRESAWGDQWDVTVDSNGRKETVTVNAEQDLAALPGEAGAKWAPKIWAAMQKAPEGGNLEPLRAGMESFYDQKIPGFLRKYGKKWGATVGQTRVQAETRKLGAQSNGWAISAPYATREEAETELRALREGRGDADTRADFAQAAPEDHHLREHDGQFYVWQQPMDVPTAPAHFIDVTPEMRKSVVEEGQSLFQRQKSKIKGWAQFFKEGNALVGLTPDADISTLGHELAHMWLEYVVPEVATKQELATLEKWAGVKSGVWTDNAKELWARGWERYDRDGVAPTPELQSIFDKFREWLTAIYQSVTGTPLDIDIEPVRPIYDLMYGGREGQQQAAQAREAGGAAVPTEDQMAILADLSEEDWQAQDAPPVEAPPQAPPVEAPTPTPTEEVPVVTAPAPPTAPAEAPVAPAGAANVPEVGTDTPAPVAPPAPAPARKPEVAGGGDDDRRRGQTAAQAPAQAEGERRRYLDRVAPLTEVQMVPTGEMVREPETFQYRVDAGQGGITDENRIDEYVPGANLEPLAVWRDTRDGKIKVVDGHHRHEAAERGGIESLPVVFIDANTVLDARIVGALRNIAAGKGTALDAAKFFRDSGLTRDDLKFEGVRLKKGTVDDGLALAALNPDLWHLVFTGDMKLTIGAAIGRHVQDHEQQTVFMETLKKAGTKRRDPGYVETLARRFYVDGERRRLQGVLFDEEELPQSFVIEEALVIDELRDRLSEDKILFGKISNRKYAQKVASAGNVIKADRNREIAERSKAAIQEFNSYAEAGGAVEQLIKAAARKLADATDRKARGEVHDEAYSGLEAAIDADHEARFQGDRAGGAEAAAPGPDAGDTGGDTEGAATGPTAQELEEQGQQALLQEDAPRKRLPRAEWEKRLRDLYDAFPAVMDREMTPQARAYLEQYAASKPKPKPEAPPKPPETAEEDTGPGALTHAQSDWNREVRRWKERAKGNKRTWERAQELAKDMTAGDEVIARATDGKPIEDFEEVWLGQELDRAVAEADAYAEKMQGMDPDSPEFEKTGNLRQAAEDRAEAVQTAMDATGSALGRALNIRKLRALENFTYPVLLHKAQKNKGEKLTEAERKEWEAKARAMQEAEAEYRRMTTEGKAARLEELQALAEAALSRKAKQAAREHRAPRARKTQDRVAGIRKERADILDQLHKRLSSRMHAISGIPDPEDVALLVRLVGTYVQEGVVRAQEIHERLLEDVPELSELQAWEAIAEIGKGGSMTPDARARMRARWEARRVARAQAEGLREGNWREAMVMRARELMKTEPSLDAVLTALEAEFGGATVLENLEAVVGQPGVPKGEKAKREAAKARNIRARAAARLVLLRHGDPFPEARRIVLEAMAAGETNLGAIAAEIRAALPGISDEDVYQAILGPKRGKKTIPWDEHKKRRDIEAQKVEIRMALDRLRPRSTTERLSGILLGITNFSRTLKSTGDISLAGRQLWKLTPRHPGIAGKALAGQVRSLLSDEFATRTYHEMLDDPISQVEEEAGLFMGKLGDDPTTAEEAFSSRLAERIPLVGRFLVKPSKRAATIGVNLMRRGVFRYGLTALEIAGENTLDNRKALAKNVNILSGRGEIGKVGEVVGKAMFAPRFAISQLQTPGTILRGSPAVQKLAVQELAAWYAFGVSALALAAMCGADVGEDERSSDWGQIIVGNMRIDVWSGMRPTAVLMNRLISRETVYRGKARKSNPVQLVGRFAWGKTNPLVNTGISWASQQFYNGEEFKWSKVPWEMTMPMTISDTMEATQKQGPEAGMAAAPLSFIGFGVNTYSPDDRGPRRK